MNDCTTSNSCLPSGLVQAYWYVGTVLGSLIERRSGAGLALEPGDCQLCAMRPRPSTTVGERHVCVHHERHCSFLCAPRSARHVRADVRASRAQAEDTGMG